MENFSETNIGSEIEDVKTENYGAEEKNLNMGEINLQETEGVQQLVFNYNAFLEKVNPLEIKPSDATDAQALIDEMRKLNPAEAEVMYKKALDKHIPLETPLE